MKCISCETEINPKWKHAIDINVCPFCGKHIMEEHLKNCIASLTVAMDDMLKYQDQLDDWLLSNHNYIKTNSPNLKLYLPKEVFKEIRKEMDDEEFKEKKRTITKVKVSDGNGGFTEEEVVVEKIQSDDRAQIFHKLANNMLKSDKAVDGDPKSVVEKTKDLRAVAQKVKREVAAAMSNKEGGMASMISKDALAEADPEAVAEFQSVIGSGDIVASGLPPVSDGDDDEIPAAVLAMANMKKNGGPDGANEKDLRALAEMQAKVRNSSKKLSSGGGSFSRG